ncbi:SUMO1 sentrin specific peptidase 8 [Homalodisca vitripennis]|nr:SUMO1 sentrin specific peptidase 8 [Homalodisca vitripennis]
MEELLIKLSSALNSLASNNPDLDLHEIVVNIELLMHKFDCLSADSISQRDDLEASESEIQSLISKLGSEKELRVKEINNSFKIQDDVNEEVVTLQCKISHLETRLRDCVAQCRNAESATNLALSNLKLEKEKNMDLIERNKTLSGSVTEANNTLSVLGCKVSSLESKGEQSWSKDKWTDDDTLNCYFETLSTSVKNQEEIVFLGPSQTHMLKLSNPDIVEANFKQLTSSALKYIFCCVNNSTSPNEDSGCHWTLLFCDVKASKAYHFDSMAGSNAHSAIKLAKTIKINANDVVEVPCFQQTNSFECGLNVLVNAKQILQFFCLDNSVTLTFEKWLGLHGHARPICSEKTQIKVPLKKTVKSKNSKRHVQQNCEALSNIQNHEWTTVKSNRKRRHGRRKLVHKEAESGPAGTFSSDVRVSSGVAATPVLPVTRNRTDTSDSKPSSKNVEGVSRLSSLFGVLIPASLRVMEDSVASVSQEIVVSPLRVCPDPVSLPLLEESSGSGYAPESGNEQIEACVLRT